jgi:hypothetical protein
LDVHLRGGKTICQTIISVSKIRSDCYHANIGDQIREINSIRWTDFDDEDHANTLLDDPKLKFICLSILPGGGTEDDDSSDDDDDEFAGSSSDSCDVSIDTDADSIKMGSVINPGPPSVADRPTGQRKIVDDNSIDGSLDDVHEHEDEGDSVSDEGQPYTTRRRPKFVNLSDASDGEDDEDKDRDQEYYDYSQENVAYDRKSGRNDDDSGDSEDEEEQGYEKNARKEVDDRIAWRKQKEKEAQDEADRAKEKERERARAVKKRKEDELKQEAEERKKKDELAQRRREAEVKGKRKPQRASVKVEKNIGQYDLNAGKKSASKAPSSGGWSKVTSPKPTSPKPSAAGWNVVSPRHKTNG